MQSKTENTAEPKVCESCGDEFGCGAKLEGCWCVDIMIPTAAAENLKSKRGDCVCPKCLASLAETDPTK